MNNLNSKINLKKGLLRMHNLMLFGLIPFFLVSYYFINRFEPWQGIKLKNGDILKVRPYVASNAEVLNPEILNTKNSEEKLFGYQFNDSSAKWNGLIRFFSKNNFPQNLLLYVDEFGDCLEIPIQENKNPIKFKIYLLKDGSLYISGHNCSEEVSKDDWKFDTLNGVIKTKQHYFKIEKRSIRYTIGGSHNVVEWSKEKLIFRHKTDSINVKYIGVDSDQKSYAILKINGDHSEDFLDQWKNNIPFFYSQEIPSNFFKFRDVRFEWSKYFNWLYWKIDDLGYYNSDNKIYFIEPPFLGMIQNCFQTEKKYFTTPFFMIYGIILVIVYIGIVRLIKWIFLGFMENSESADEKENSDLKQPD
jgi:hypothetical protein